jgi:Uma2 family endonuclease
MVAARQVTVEEFATMPLDGLWELIDGELVEVTPAADEPSSTGMTIGYLLVQHVRPAGLGRVYGADGGFVLFPDRNTVLVPDVAFVTKERAPKGEARKKFPRLAPDLAVEVLSPSDRMADALAKVAMYLQAGTQLVWLVNPTTRTVVVFRSALDPVTLGESDTLDGGDVLPGFSVPVAEIFS